MYVVGFKATCHPVFTAAESYLWLPFRLAMPSGRSFRIALAKALGPWEGQLTCQTGCAPTGNGIFSVSQDGVFPFLVESNYGVAFRPANPPTELG